MAYVAKCDYDRDPQAGRPMPGQVTAGCASETHFYSQRRKTARGT